MWCWNEFLTMTFWFCFRKSSLPKRGSVWSQEESSGMSIGSRGYANMWFYSCPGRQRPKIQKPLSLNGTVGPTGACLKPKPGRLDLKPNRAFLCVCENVCLPPF